jgi:hypothetical protein
MGIHFPWSNPPKKEPEIVVYTPWEPEEERVGNCPDCGAPVYEKKEVKHRLRGIEKRCHSPHQIVYTCDCKTLNSEPFDD